MGFTGKGVVVSVLDDGKYCSKLSRFSVSIFEYDLFDNFMS